MWQGSEISNGSKAGHVQCVISPVLGGDFLKGVLVARFSLMVFSSGFDIMNTYASVPVLVLYLFV